MCALAVKAMQTDKRSKVAPSAPTCVKLAAQNAKSMIMTIAKRARKPALPLLPNAAKWWLNHPLQFLEESPALLRYAQPIYSLGFPFIRKMNGSQK